MVRIDCSTDEAELAALACVDAGAVAVWEDPLGDRVVLRAGVPSAQVDDVIAGAALLGLVARDVTDEEVLPLPATTSVVEVAGRTLELVVPGDVFGDARHPTTRTCLEVLVALDPAGRRVLDVGCGSGVLGLAAAALGASEVVAVDVSPAAVSATRAGAVRNGLVVQAREGSAADVGGSFDVVLANLSAATLVAIAPHLRRLGRTLVLSGMLDEQAAQVEEVLGPPVERRRAQGWTTLVVRPT